MPASPVAQVFTREQVCRLLPVTRQQLEGWQRQKLVGRADGYSYSDLIAMRTLLKLRSTGLKKGRLQRVLRDVRAKLREVTDPLKDVRLTLEDGECIVKTEGLTLELKSGQLLFEFDSGVQALAFEVKAPQADDGRAKRLESEGWFQQGLELEQRGAPVQEVIAAYEKAADLDERSAGSLVNLGTIYFNARMWKESEKYYLRALQVDSEYALAHFNLGNLYDERNNRRKAQHHYDEALRLKPNYADAHYNLALLNQGSGEVMKAIKHWKHYLKLDPSSSWSDIARRELKKLADATLVPGPAKPSLESAKEKVGRERVVN